MRCEGIGSTHTKQLQSAFVFVVTALDVGYMFRPALHIVNMLPLPVRANLTNPLTYA